MNLSTDERATIKRFLEEAHKVMENMPPIIPPEADRCSDNNPMLALYEMCRANMDNATRMHALVLGLHEQIKARFPNLSGTDKA